MNIRKVLQVAGIVALAALLISAYTPVGQQQMPIAPKQADETIRLITPGKLTIGYFPAPGAFELENGQPIGVEGILMTEIAKRLGLEPVYQPFDKPSAIAALLSGRVDILGAGLSVQPPRAQVVSFAEPWLLQAEGISVLPGTEIPSWEQAAANKQTLATVVGYSYIPNWEQLGINIHTFDSIDACFLDVVNKGAAGCAVGTFDLVYRKATVPESAVSKLTVSPVAGPNIFADLNAIAVGKDNPALAHKVSQLMTDMWRDGTVEKAYQQTFKGTDVSIFINPPKGSALYYPGPWEDGVFAPASEVYSPVKTISPGQLTVGVPTNSILLKLDGDKLSGPEASILEFAANKLGLKVKAVSVAEPITALKEGQVDLIAGQIPATEAASHLYWQSRPIGFDPDYIYIKPGAGGDLTSWEDAKKAGGKLAIVKGNPRVDQLKAAGVDFMEVADTVAGLKALADDSALGLVASAPEFNAAVSSDPALVNTGFGWVRNTNLFTSGSAYVWGVKAGNGQLLDALNQAIVAAWQQLAITNAYRTAFPGANITSLLAPGPTAIGSSFSSSRDYLLRGIWLPGPWLQRPDWVK